VRGSAANYFNMRREDIDIFFLATRFGDVNRMRQIAAEYPEVVHSTTSEGTTALGVASSRGLLETVKELLCLGADLNSCDDSGKSALSAACEHGQVPVVIFLLQQNAACSSLF
jgi:ankyrin repeat protein